MPGLFRFNRHDSMATAVIAAALLLYVIITSLPDTEESAPAAPTPRQREEMRLFAKTQNAPSQAAAKSAPAQAGRERPRRSVLARGRAVTTTP